MTTGTKCCEHHREGLPYCVDCEMESDQLREKLHSKLAETEQAGETLKSKLAGAEIALEKARAEVERLSSRDGNAKHELIYDDGDNPFVREKLEHIDFVVCDNEYVLESHLLNNALEGLKAKDKLIEQMREALQWYKEQVSSCNRNGDAGELARDRLAKDVGKRAEAALAAEGGE